MDNAVTAAVEGTFTAAPGSVVVIRDQEWLVTNIEKATHGWFVHVQGLSELVRDTEATFCMLELSAGSPDGELDEDLVKRLIIRRHRHSPDVASTVGADWAEWMPPRNLLVPAAPVGIEIAEELEQVWLNPADSVSPVHGNNRFFPWTLAKALLSSPAALLETLKERRRRIGSRSDSTSSREDKALPRAGMLTCRPFVADLVNYGKHVDLRGDMGVKPRAWREALIPSGKCDLRRTRRSAASVFNASGKVQGGRRIRVIRAITHPWPGSPAAVSWIALPEGQPASDVPARGYHPARVSDQRLWGEGRRYTNV